MNEIILSKKNSNIKYAHKLLNSSSFRKSEKLFIIEGIRICTDVVNSGVEIVSVFYTKKCYNKFQEIVNKIISISSSAFLVDDSVINYISDTKSPQGIVCICRKVKFVDYESFKNEKKILILENIQDPSNLGSIFRTCDALNIENVILSKDSCDIYNLKALRASMGATFRLNIHIPENITEIIKKLKSYNFKLYATVPSEEAINISDLEFSNEKIAAIFGNEGNGISKGTLELCDKKITIPMNPDSESLNVSVAVGIILWHIKFCGGGK